MFRGNEKANVGIESLNGYKAISDYGIIGTCQEAALVGLDGSIH